MIFLVTFCLRSLKDCYVLSPHKDGCLFVCASEHFSECSFPFAVSQPQAVDSLDVYIEHRLLMEQQLRARDGANIQRDPRNMFPPELLRRL